MTPEERAKLLGDELTRAVDATVAAFAHTPAQRAALGDLIAAMLGRQMSLYAGQAVEVLNLKVRVADLEREAGGEH